ncbi:MAG: RibD family protein [Gammaproteobacteria bacterium]|nr:RibD family protein [Gammaproteobacteria bacterium]
MTSEASRLEVHQLRAESDLVITGVETVLADDPALTVRHVETEANPARLVVDSRLRTPVTARLLTEPGATTIVCIEGQQFAAGDLEQAGARVLALPEARGRVSLPALMARLGADEINEVLVEAGATLTGALLEQGLVDELILYVGPCLLGSAGRGMAELPGVTEMSQRLALDILAVQPVGRDWRITARPDRTAETGAH